MAPGEPLLTRRRFLHASAAAALATALPSCSRPSPPSGPPVRTVRMAGNTFGFPSPFAYIGGPGYVQMSFVYDTLLWTDGGGRLLPWIARRYERSPDGRTYTFQVRPGIRWHDGRPLTAADVAFTFEYFLDQPLGPLLIAQPVGVASARARDETVVDIHLERPAVTFPEKVAGSVPIIPKHVWTQIGDAPRAQELDVLVGSGPYRLASFSRAEGSLLYRANPDYFLGRPAVDRLELVPVDDEINALRAGTVDVAETPVEGVRPEVLAPFDGDDAFAVVAHTGGFTFPLIYNAGRGGALADSAFRRACALAVDRQAIVDRLLGGNGVPGNPGFLPPDHAFHVGVEQYEADVRAANRLLDEAGYRPPAADGVRRGPDSRRLSFEILTGNAPVPAVLPLLVGSLARIGVALEAVSVDLPTLFGRLKDHDNEIALSLHPGPGGSAPNADPDVLRTFYSSRIVGRLQGAQGWQDATFDRLAAEQLVTADPQARGRLLADMQHIVADEVPALPLYYPTLFAAFRRGVFDAWYYTPGGFAGGLPGIRNKHALVTGQRSGLGPGDHTPTAAPSSPGRR